MLLIYGQHLPILLDMSNSEESLRLVCVVEKYPIFRIKTCPNSVHVIDATMLAQRQPPTSPRSIQVEVG
jgi:hypothetical protein